MQLDARSATLTLRSIHLLTWVQQGFFGKRGIHVVMGFGIKFSARLVSPARQRPPRLSVGRLCRTTENHPYKSSIPVYPGQKVLCSRLQKVQKIYLFISE
jgi:hypothetical protein